MRLRERQRREQLARQYLAAPAVGPVPSSAIIRRFARRCSPASRRRWNADRTRFATDVQFWLRCASRKLTITRVEHLEAIYAPHLFHVGRSGVCDRRRRLVSNSVSAQAKPQATASASAAAASDARDLQGIWGFATVTPLQRPKEFAGRDVLTAGRESEARRAGGPRSVRRPAAAAGNPGAYNRFWIDAGTKAVATGRTSLIVDPPDGRLPPLTPQGKDRQAALDERRNRGRPEALTTWDRCILGFNAGPPMIGGGYNAYVQLFQTADYVVLHTEMVHDARIVPLNGRPPLPSHIASGGATRAAAGKATRSSSRRRTSGAKAPAR